MGADTLFPTSYCGGCWPPGCGQQMPVHAAGAHLQLIHEHWRLRAQSCRPAAARPLRLSCRALRMMVLPLVAGCIAGAVCSLRGAGTSMGSVATWTLSLFLSLTFCAALLGVVLGATARPGRGHPFQLGGWSKWVVKLPQRPAWKQQRACCEYGSLSDVAGSVLACLLDNAGALSATHGPCACRSVLLWT